MVCACAKCGSTSLFKYIYEREFNQSWPHKGIPFVQQTTSNRWLGRFKEITDSDRQSNLMSNAYSFALVRDPKARLVSAWKSKVACDHFRSGVDKNDRSILVPELQRLAGWPTNSTCMSLDEFVRALHAVHTNGNSHLLNIHFLPQDQGCFKDYPVSEWSKVVPISMPGAFDALAERLGHDRGLAPPAKHKSSGAKIVMGLQTAEMLDHVTRGEYDALSAILNSTWPLKRQPKEENPLQLKLKMQQPGVHEQQEGSQQQPQQQPEQQLEQKPEQQKEENEEQQQQSSQDPQQPEKHPILDWDTMTSQGTETNNETTLPAELSDLSPTEVHLDFMPGHNLVTCACARCGSASMYKYIWEKEFGEAWPYKSTRPLVTQTMSDRWENRFMSMAAESMERDIITKAHSIVFIRDPKERLMSAWKSKVACNHEKTNVNAADRSRLVPELMRLEGSAKKDVKCLTFSDFVKVLHSIHKKGRSAYLNKHFLPQDLGCFRHLKPGAWKDVVDIAAPTPLVSLARGLGEPEGIEELVELPRTRKSQVIMSPETVSMLSEVTANEYEILESYLHPMHEEKLRQNSVHSPAAVALDGAPHVQEAWEPYKFRLNFMPDRGLVTCACSRCGSTALYSYIYEREFGHKWPFTGRPFVQQLASRRWESRFQVIEDAAQQEQVMDNAFSIAFIRDPKERLMSAWRAKVACDHAGTNVDREDRARIVPELRRLEDRTANGTCLSFKDFVVTLYNIHQMGRARYLNAHFLPQDQSCFQKFPADKWRKVVMIQDPLAFDLVGSMVGEASEDGKAPARPSTMRRSRSVKIKMDEKVQKLLDSITASEYEAVGDFLSQ